MEEENKLTIWAWLMLYLTHKKESPRPAILDKSLHTFAKLDYVLMANFLLLKWVVLRIAYKENEQILVYFVL